MASQRETIVIPLPLPKRRAGVMPTKKERDRKNDYRRKSKHQKKGHDHA